MQTFGGVGAWGAGGGWSGAHYFIHYFILFREENAQRTTLQQAGRCSRTQQTRNNLQSSSKHSTGKQASPTKGRSLKFRVKPQAVPGFTGIRARVRQIVEAWVQFH
jgi:hypothetical protein